MGFDDDFDDELGDEFDSEESGFDDEESQNTDEHEETEGFFDPLDITDPKNVYFILSDDALVEKGNYEKKSDKNKYVRD